MAPAFACRRLTKRYGATTALVAVDLEVERGELLGLLGPNGAGKSTLTKIACGLVRADDGDVEVEGAPAGSARARASVGYLAELFRFPDWLSADELLSLHQSLAGSSGGPRERVELLELVELSEASGTRVDAMSKGMQQRLGIAQALVGEPQVLMLDEPTSALDPVGRRIVRDLLTTHLLSEVELVCDRVAILDRGRIVARGTPHELVRPRGVEIETGTGLRSYPSATRAQVPAIVTELVERGEDVYEVRLLSSSLEDAYLEAVGGPAQPARELT